MMPESTEEYLNHFLEEARIMLTTYELVKKLIEVADDAELKKRYNDYWLFSYRAHAYTFFLSVSRFFDKNQKTRYFFVLINNLNDSEIEELYAKLEKEWRSKYKKFRDKYVAHFAKNISKSDEKSVPELTIPTAEMLMSEDFKVFLQNLLDILSRVHGHYRGKEAQIEPYNSVLSEFDALEKKLRK